MDLTVQHLRTVLAVADTGSFTGASTRLRLAQSSLSRAIADIERRVGVTLFERTTRRVQLTPEGQEFLDIARDIVRSFDRGMNHFSGFLDGTRGVVRIATLPSLAATLLPSVIATYRGDFPDVAVRIDDALLGQVLEQVDGGHVDFAVTVADEEVSRLAAQPVATDEFFCVFPPAHRFATAGSLRWSDLHDEPFIAFDPLSSVRTHADTAFAAADASPRLVTEARNIAAVGGLVAAQLGVSAVPGLVLPLLEFAGLGHCPLVEPEVRRTIAVVTDPSRPMAPAARSFLQVIAEARSSNLRLPAGAQWLTNDAEPGREP
jgi:LysR family transcriptional regulator, carnitine catabolism transcriptional activator